MKTGILLVVEDDENVNRLITDYFQMHGYKVISTTNGEDALAEIEKNGLPHLALIDLSLQPSMNGFDLSHKIKMRADVPIIFVSANGETDTIVEGLRKYGDDFVVKPFEMRELAVRVQVVLNRIPGIDYAKPKPLRIDEMLGVDFSRGHIIIQDQDEKKIGITPKESMLLSILIRNAGRVVENRALIARTWPGETVVNEDTLRVHMHRLRRKIEPDPRNPRYIRTERGVGYLFMVRPNDEITQNTDT